MSEVYNETCSKDQIFDLLLREGHTLLFPEFCVSSRQRTQRQNCLEGLRFFSIVYVSPVSVPFPVPRGRKFLVVPVVVPIIVPPVTKTRSAVIEVVSMASFPFPSAAVNVPLGSSGGIKSPWRRCNVAIPPWSQRSGKETLSGHAAFARRARTRSRRGSAND